MHFACVKRQKIMHGCEWLYQCHESVWLCDFHMVLTGRTQVCGCEAELLQNIFYSSHENISSIFSLADCALQNQFSTQENLI